MKIHNSPVRRYGHHVRPVGEETGMFQEEYW